MNKQNQKMNSWLKFYSKWYNLFFIMVFVLTFVSLNQSPSVAFSLMPFVTLVFPLLYYLTKKNIELQERVEELENKETTMKKGNQKVD